MRNIDGFAVYQDLTSASVQRTLFVRADHGSTVDVAVDRNRLQHLEPGNYVSAERFLIPDGYRGNVSRETLMIHRAVRILVLICLAVIVSSPLSAQKEMFTYYAVNTGGVDRTDLEAHLRSATPTEVDASLGLHMVSARGLVLILALVTNKNRSEPLRVSPSSVHLKLKSGEIILNALSPAEVSAWAQDRGVSKIPRPDLLQGFEVKKGESVVALAAAFRLPKGVEAKRVEAEMTLELGKEETLQVKSTLRYSDGYR